MKLKTVYDWREGQRGRILEPKGNKTELATIVILRSSGGVLGELYRSGGLYGQALADAKEQFGLSEKEKTMFQKISKSFVVFLLAFVFCGSAVAEEKKANPPDFVYSWIAPLAFNDPANGLSSTIAVMNVGGRRKVVDVVFRNIANPREEHKKTEIIQRGQTKVFTMAGARFIGAQVFVSCVECDLHVNGWLEKFNAGGTMTFLKKRTGVVER